MKIVLLDCAVYQDVSMILEHVREGDDHTDLGRITGVVSPVVDDLDEVTWLHQLTLPLLK